MRIYGEGGDWSEEAQRARWHELMSSGGSFPSGHNDYTSGNGGLQLRWQLALIDMPDSGLDFVPGSHARFRTELEDAAMGARSKARDGIEVDNAIAHDGIAPIPPHEGSGGSTAVALKAGQTAYWNGDGMHRGFTKPGVERLSLSCAYVKWNGLAAVGQDAGRVEINGRRIDTLDMTKKINLMDPRLVWKLDPAVRHSLPTEWMKLAWDRWCSTQPATYEELVEEGSWENRERTGHGRDNSSNQGKETVSK